MGLLKLPFSDLASFQGVPPELAEARKVVRSLSQDTAWNHADVNFRLLDALKKFHVSNETLKKQNFDGVFLSNRFTQGEYGYKAYEIISSWEKSSSPVLPAIVARAGDYFGFNDSQRAIAGMSAVLGCCETGLSYHNAAHNRKVAVQTMRLIAATPELGTDRVCELLSAACIHDLGHTGKGNMVDGNHVPFHLEKRACALAAPYLTKAGATDDFMANVTTLVCATDVSPLGSPDAPALRVASGRDLSGELSLLENPELRKAAQILQVADVASSAGLCPEQSWRESCAVSREFGQEPECGKTVSNFHFFMKASQPVFDALPEAGKLYGQNLLHIKECIGRYAVSQLPPKSQPA